MRVDCIVWSWVDADRLCKQKCVQYILCKHDSAVSKLGLSNLKGLFHEN